MRYFFASEATIPVRAETREAEEMISQLVFGDVVIALEGGSGWTKVRNTGDGYEGWVSTNMLCPMAEEEVAKWPDWRYITTPSFLWPEGGGASMMLPAGARIPETNGENAFQIGNRRWEMKEVLGIEPADRSMLVPLAQHFLYTPYLWGGKSSFGIDCSGLTQTIYRMCGISIPRDSSIQQKKGKTIPFGQHQAGDLAFFSKKGQQRVTHVGIIMNHHQLIHASGRVRIDDFVEQGIQHAVSQQLTHHLVSINRYF